MEIGIPKETAQMLWRNQFNTTWWNWARDQLQQEANGTGRAVVTIGGHAMGGVVLAGGKHAG